MVLTGGDGHRYKTVKRYDRDLKADILSDLNVGRSNHGCGIFWHNDTKVCIGKCKIQVMSLSFFQFYIVVGGGNNVTENLQSTEILIATFGGNFHWLTVGPLPAAMRELAGASINNTVYMSG